MTEKIAALASSMYEEHKNLVSDFHNYRKQVNVLKQFFHENQISCVNGEIQIYDDDYLTELIDDTTIQSDETALAIETQISESKEIVDAQLDEFIEYAMLLDAQESLRKSIKRRAAPKRYVAAGAPQDALPEC